MDLIDRVRDIANRIETHKEHILTEEAAKTSLVMPFLSALGYDVFNPSEVVPEFTADVGTKKGEKVDYAIKKDGKIIILIECKGLDADLNKEHASQLFRYFSVTEARFALLTNGSTYRFYSDLEQPNKMDSRPFFEFNLRDFKEDDIEELKKFSRHAFALDNILQTANTLKYLRAIKKVLADDFNEPSDGFARLIIGQVFDGRITAQTLEFFKPIIKTAVRQVLEDSISDRLKFALNSQSTSITLNTDAPKAEEAPASTNETAKSEIITTQDELDGFLIIKALLRQIVDLKRITMRDTKSYCGILLDDNNRKPICRLHFNYSQKYIGFVVDKQEERVPIQDLNDIYSHADRIIATTKSYLGS